MTSTRGLVAVLSALAISATATLGGGVAHAIPGTAAPSGVDVAGHQHPGGQAINWNKVRGDGQSFAFIKATEGSDFTNDHFADDVRQAQAAGMKVGAYHYALPSDDPARQAQHFASKVAQLPAGSLPPVLDIEVPEGKSPQQLINWTRVFLSETERLTGRKPMVYTYRYFWTDHMGNTTQFSEYPLWLAAYQAKAPKPMGGWDEMAFWQRSDSGRVKGIAAPVDMNLFNGNAGQLESFSSGNLNNFGGVIDDLILPGGPLDALGADNTALIGAILALAATGAAAPAVIDAAEKAGLSGSGAQEILGQVKALDNAGKLPKADLKKMAVGDYNIGDLLILLDNAEHLDAAQKDQAVGHGGGAPQKADASQVKAAAGAARGAGVNVPDFDARQVARDVNALAATMRRFG